MKWGNTPWKRSARSRKSVTASSRSSAADRVIQPRSTATTIAITPKPVPPIAATSSPGSASSRARSLASPLTGCAKSQK